MVAVRDAPAWRAMAAATVAEAVGRSHRNDPRRARTGGPAGNARLTAWVGVLLLVGCLAELATLLDVHRWISWHVVIGAVLLPPALLKTGSTGWRIARYYLGNADYRTAGPPPMPLRVLGPLVVATTLGVLGSGIALIAVSPNRAHDQLLSVVGQRVDWVTLHQACFVVWAGATGLHVLARLVPAIGIAVTRPVAGDRVEGRVARSVVLLAVAGAAAVTAVLLLAAASSWRTGDWGNQ